MRGVWLAALNGLVYSLSYTLLFPLAATLSACLFKERSLAIIIPRYLLVSSTAIVYFIPQAPTSALTSSRKDVKQLVYFQILQNADNIFFTQ